MTIGPPDAPPPARPKTRWEIYGPRHPRRLLLLALGAIVVICGGVIAFGPRLSNLPGGADMCGWQLRQLGKNLVGESVERGAYPEDAGAALLIGWVRDGTIPAGREGLLVCGRDHDALRIESDDDRALFHTVDLADPAALTQLCSYAIRDFKRYPVDLDDETAWLMCERQGADGRTRHHYGGLNVLFADGSVRYLWKEDLGLDPARRIIVGPDSPHPELRKMLFVPGPAGPGQKAK